MIIYRVSKLRHWTVCRSWQRREDVHDWVGSACQVVSPYRRVASQFRIIAGQRCAMRKQKIAPAIALGSRFSQHKWNADFCPLSHFLICFLLISFTRAMSFPRIHSELPSTTTVHGWFDDIINKRRCEINYRRKWAVRWKQLYDFNKQTLLAEIICLAGAYYWLASLPARYFRFNRLITWESRAHRDISRRCKFTFSIHTSRFFSFFSLRVYVHSRPESSSDKHAHHKTVCKYLSAKLLR